MIISTQKKKSKQTRNVKIATRDSERKLNNNNETLIISLYFYDMI